MASRSVQLQLGAELDRVRRETRLPISAVGNRQDYVELEGSQQPD